MKAEDNDKRLDGLIRSAIGREGLQFDFRQWQRDHQQQIREFKSEMATGRDAGAFASGLAHRIMIARVSKLVVAAVILVAVLIGVSRFTGSLDGTTAAYAKVTQAVRSVPWMHIRYTVYDLDKEGNKIHNDGELDTEIWYSFNAQVVIQRFFRGRIVYNDYAKQEVDTYSPSSKRIVLSALPANGLPVQADSPWSWLERNIQRMTPYGGDVTRRRGQYDGQDVDIFEIASATRPGMAAIRGKIFVDRTTFLPLAEERTYVDTDTGRLLTVEKGTFDYPEHGPANIYALGVSPDTPTINNLPLPPWWEITWAYESHRQAPPERYVAVVTRQMNIGGNPIDTVDVFYVDGARCREERHFAFHTGFIGEQWERQAGELGTTFDSILKWSRTYKAYGGVSVWLFDGNRYYESRRDQNDSWSTTERTFGDNKLTKDDFWTMCPVFRLGWPDIWGEPEVIQDDYARENHLMRLETQRGVFYLNPERDYICQRRIIHPDDRVEEVTEFGKTDDGRWYPRKIKGNGLTHTVYLEIPPELPEGLFDPNRLPKAKP